MRKIFLVTLMGAILVGCPVLAEEEEKAKETSDNRPDLNLLMMQNPFNAKQLYREAWEMDNEVPLSTIGKLEYVQTHNPGLDADTMEIVRRGTAMMKKMNFGLKEADMAKDAATIRQNSPEVLTEISDGTVTKATPADAFSAADIMEPTKRLTEKMYKDKSLGRKSYQINIDSF